VYLGGLLADLAAMVRLIASWPVVHQQALAYGLLLAATGCLGAGFGLTVPSLNTLTAALHPNAVDKSVLVLNGAQQPRGSGRSPGRASRPCSGSWQPSPCWTGYARR
jgi:hypothetical protein